MCASLNLAMSRTVLSCIFEHSVSRKLSEGVRHLSERKMLSGINYQVQRNPTYPVTLPIVTSECDWYPLDKEDKTSACGQKVDAFCTFTGLVTL